MMTQVSVVHVPIIILEVVIAHLTTTIMTITERVIHQGPMDEDSPEPRAVGVNNLLFNATDMSPHVKPTTTVHTIIHYSYQDANTVD